jgi:hypothetical protein
MQENYAPALLKKININGNSRWELAFSLRDFLKGKKIASKKKEALDTIVDMLEHIKKLLPDGKPSKVLRKNLWDIGDLIITTRDKIAKENNIYITNFIENIAKELNLADRTINFMVQFRNIISKEEIDENISWKMYQEALLLIDKSKFKECIQLIKNGKLKNTNDLLTYVQKTNQKTKLVLGTIKVPFQK